MFVPSQLVREGFHILSLDPTTADSWKNPSLNFCRPPPEVAKALALETIHTRYPEDQWLHVYTDGSLQNPEEGAGAGITCNLFSFYKNMGKNIIHFDGKITAIKISIQQLTYRIHHLKKSSNPLCLNISNTGNRKFKYNAVKANTRTNISIVSTSW